jgi:hypothetical protein
MLHRAVFLAQNSIQQPPYHPLYPDLASDDHLAPALIRELDDPTMTLLKFEIEQTGFIRTIYRDLIRTLPR